MIFLRTFSFYHDISSKHRTFMDVPERSQKMTIVQEQSFKIKNQIFLKVHDLINIHMDVHGSKPKFSVKDQERPGTIRNDQLFTIFTN